MARCKRPAFTLLELILALGLSVLVMSIIVGLIGMYSSNFTKRGEDIRRVALARAILNMIADDLRSTVTKQEYDTKVLEQMLMGQGGGGAGAQGGGGQADGGGAGGGGQDNNSRDQNPGNPQPGNPQPGNPAPGNPSPGTPAPQNPGSGGGGGGFGGGGFGGGTGGRQSGQANQTAGASGANQNAAGTDEAPADATAGMASLPLGIYGSATNLTIDISRIPRIDEYTAQQNGMLTGTLNDLPGDIKSVSYYVQAPSTVGVTDAMNQVSTTQTATGVGGLVRRALDRAVLDNAESMGQTDQLNRTGELVAPEVLALEFSYFDGAQWTTTWDSSTQGLPWLVDISLAMQSKTGEKNGTVPPGISLTTMTYDERAKYGIEIYTLTVTIPGAQLQSTGATTGGAGAGTDSGMSSMGL